MSKRSYGRWIVVALTAIVLAATTDAASAQSSSGAVAPAAGGLRYEKMLYLRNETVDTVPQGKVWQIQTIWAGNEAIGAQQGSFMSGFRGDSEAVRLFNSQIYLNSLRIMGTPLHATSLPFFLDAGATVSPGGKGKILVIAQYRIE